MKTNLPLFYGIPAVYFIWRGEWSDPQIRYRGHVVNYFEVENYFWSMFREEFPNGTEEDFDKWLPKQGREVKQFILDIAA